MITKNILLLIGALTVLCAGVVGVNAYLSKKTAPVTETPEKITEESTVTEPEESTSTVPEEISSTSEIDTADWRTYRNDKLGIEFSYPIFQDKNVKITEVSSEYGEVWAVKIIIDETNSYETIMISKTKKEYDLCEHLDLYMLRHRMKKCVDRNLTNSLGTLDESLTDSGVIDYEKYLGHKRGVSGKMLCGTHGDPEYDEPVSIGCDFGIKKEDYIIEGNVYGASLWYILQTGGPRPDKITDREIVKKRKSTVEKNFQAVNQLVSSNMLPLREDVVDTINMVYETLVID